MTLNLILQIFKFVCAIFTQNWLEVKNYTGDLLKTIGWLSSGKHRNSSICKSNSTLDVKSVDSVRALLQNKGPVHVRSIIFSCQFVEVHDSRLDSQLSIYDESEDGLILPVH